MSPSKILPHNALKLALSKTLQKIIEAVGNKDQKNLPALETIYGSIGPCSKPELGHMTYSCFSLAKEWKVSPVQVAQTLQEQSKNLAENLVIKVAAAGPYLNFTFDLSKSLGVLLEEISSEKYFKISFLSQKEKIMVEYSQPNTHKEMHVGHMRNLCLGASILELYKYLGHEVISCTYPGDVGTHVAKCLWYYKKNALQPPMERKGAWLGSIYSKAHLLLEDELGTEKEEQNRQELTLILKEIHAQQGPFFDLWKETRNWSLDLMKDVYDWVGIKFDRWFFESEVDAPSLKLVDEYFNNGVFIRDQGAIGIDLSSDGLGFCLLKKSDGNGLYATKDLELARFKFQQFKITKNVYVVDVRQSLHFKQVFKTLEKMGFENARKSYHLAYEMVELPEGAMSSRKGNIIPIQTLIDTMQEKIKNQYLEKYSNEWPKDEIALCTHRIAIAAIKYGMLKIDPGKKIIFDLTEWLKVDGNSGPYLLYSYARAGSILAKAHFNLLSNTRYSNTQFVEPIEAELLMKMWMYNEAATDAAEKNSPNILCNYLYELCQNMNTFYAHCSIINAPTDESKSARLYLLHSVRVILKHGLELLGIHTVERM